MQGFLIAHEPAIKPVSMGRVPNREVYLLLCRLLGIEAAAHDASGVLAEEMLRH